MIIKYCNFDEFFVDKLFITRYLTIFKACNLLMKSGQGYYLTRKLCKILNQVIFLISGNYCVHILFLAFFSIYRFNTPLSLGCPSSCFLSWKRFWSSAIDFPLVSGTKQVYKQIHLNFMFFPQKSQLLALFWFNFNLDLTDFSKIGLQKLFNHNLVFFHYKLHLMSKISICPNPVLEF